MDCMELLIHLKQTKGILYNFGGILLRWEKLEDGNIIILEFLVQFH